MTGDRDMAVLVDGFASGVIVHGQDVLNADAESLTAEERNIIATGCRMLMVAVTRADYIDSQLTALLGEPFVEPTAERNPDAD